MDPAGNSGRPGSASVLDTEVPSVRSSDTLDFRDVSGSATPANINSIQFCVQNNENDNLIFLDYIYIEIKYSP